MLTFLVLATTSGGALSPDATARLSAVPGEVLTHQPETRTVWLSEAQNVGFAGWETRPAVVGGSHWHVGDHGVTAVAGGPWPTDARFGGDTPWASQLTARLSASSPREAIRGLSGTFALVRLDAAGRGWVTADVTGAGPVHVAQHGGVLAVSNRAELALDAVHPATRQRRDPESAAALPWLGSTAGASSPYRDVTTIGAGQAVVIDPRQGASVEHATPVWHDAGGSSVADQVAAVAQRLRSDLAGLAELPAPRRVIDLTDPGDARVVLAAAAAAGVADHFELVVRGRDGDGHVPVARALAAAVGCEVGLIEPVADDLAGLDRSLREQVAATGAAIAADLAGPPPVREEALVVTGRGAGMLRAHAEAGTHGPIEDRLGVDPAGILTVEVRRDLNSWLRDRCRAHVAAGVAEQDTADLVHLEQRLPRQGAADAVLAAPATVVDPTRSADVALLALTAGSDRRAGTLQDELVAALSPAVAGVALTAKPAVTASWDSLYPLFEGELLGRPGGPLDEALERDVVRRVLRGDEPAAEVIAALWAATTAAVWLSGGEAPAVVARRPPQVRVLPRRPERPPVLITGVTSRSFIDLAQLKIPLERTARDPLLAVRIDREVAELTERLLATVDAALGDIPPDLDDRLASPETAGFADAAAQLLARRGGILADPRLGLTLPFWNAHVAPPQVVLVAERPTDLLARLERPLPAERVLAAWLDVVSATLTTTDGVRCVDPDDIAEGPIGPEGDASAAYPGPDRTAFDDLLSVTSVIDSLIRELEVEAVRPIVAELRRARLAARRPPARRQDGAHFPLAALDAMTELRRQVAESQGEAAARTAERDEALDRLGRLRARRSVRWAVGAARLLGRPRLDEP